MLTRFGRMGSSDEATKACRYGESGGMTMTPVTGLGRNFTEINTDAFRLDRIKERG